VELKALHVPLAATCSLVVIALFVWLWRKRRDDLPVMFGAVVFVTLLASPHALIYEWALLAITGILWWPATRRHPDAWFLVYGLVWLTLFVSTHFAELMLKVQEYLGAAATAADLDRGAWRPVAVQISVPGLFGVFWWAVRRLRRDADGLTDAAELVGKGGATLDASAGEPDQSP
jgi:hypothetical protein